MKEKTSYWKQLDHQYLPFRVLCALRRKRSSVSARGADLTINAKIVIQREAKP